MIEVKTLIRLLTDQYLSGNYIHSIEVTDDGKLVVRSSGSEECPSWPNEYSFPKETIERYQEGLCKAQ